MRENDTAAPIRGARATRTRDDLRSAGPVGHCKALVPHLLIASEPGGAVKGLKLEVPRPQVNDNHAEPRDRTGAGCEIDAARVHATSSTRAPLGRRTRAV
jgi:hypothetical protein